MTKEYRDKWRKAIEVYFSNSKDYKILERVDKGFYFSQKGEKKSCYTEVGETSGDSHSTFAIPYSYKEKPFSLGAANTNYYAVIFPEAKVLCIGRPKKIRLWVASTRSEVDYFTDDMGIEWVWVKRKSLDNMFDKVESLE